MTDAIDAIWDCANGEGVCISSLLRDRVIWIRLIATLPEYNVIRFEYLEEKRPDVAEWEPGYGAWTSARDDIGTEYDDWGGAAGVSADGRMVEGEFDVHPAPPSEATWMELVFHPYYEANAGNQPQFVLRIPAPLPSITFEKWISLNTRYRHL